MESYCFNMKSTIEDSNIKDKLDDSERKTITDKCNEAISWLERNQTKAQCIMSLFQVRTSSSPTTHLNYSPGWNSDPMYNMFSLPCSTLCNINMGSCPDVLVVYLLFSYYPFRVCHVLHVQVFTCLLFKWTISIKCYDSIQYKLEN